MTTDRGFAGFPCLQGRLVRPGDEGAGDVRACATGRCPKVSRGAWVIFGTKALSHMVIPGVKNLGCAETLPQKEKVRIILYCGAEQ